MNVVETLQAEHTELTGKLGELDERIKSERPALVAQISQLSKAISALTKPASTPGTRKPMSEEGKAAIKAGFEKSRAAKAALAAGEPVQGAAQQTRRSVVRHTTHSGCGVVQPHPSKPAE